MPPIAGYNYCGSSDPELGTVLIHHKKSGIKVAATPINLVPAGAAPSSLQVLYHYRPLAEDKTRGNKTLSTWN